MTIQAQTADGVIHEFPDGTPGSVIDGAMRDYTAAQAGLRSHNGGVTISLDKDATPTTEGVTGFMANVNRGLGIGDEMAAGFKTAADLATGRAKFGTDKPGNPVMNNIRMIGDTYKNELAGQRQDEDAYTAQHPHLAALARGAGTAMTMAAPIGPGAEAFQGGNLMTNALRGTTVAGLTGAGYAAVDRGSLQERAAAAAHAARDPVTLGMGAVAGSLATTGSTTAGAPSLDDLVAQKDAAYQDPALKGVRYTPQAFKGLTEDMANAVDEAGFHAGLHPKTAAMLERIGVSDRGVGGYSPTPAELDQLRQQIGRDVASSKDPGEQRMGVVMRGVLDRFMQNADPGQMVGGADPGQAAQVLSTARDLNTRIMKLRSLDGLDQAAEDRAAVTGSGGNINNTTRQNVLRFKNNTGNLTPAEQAAAQTVIDGTPTGNALRLVGKLSPEGNGLASLAHVGSITAELGTGHSPVAMTQAGVALTGAISKRVSDAMTSRNVQALRDLIASGGKAAQQVSVALADPQYADLRRQLANDLAGQAGVQGASRPSMTGAPPLPATAQR